MGLDKITYVKNEFFNGIIFVRLIISNKVYYFILFYLKIEPHT